MGASVISIAIFLILIKVITERLEAGLARFYAEAEKEYDNGEANDNLWLLALVKASGNEDLRKLEYMKLRAKSLKNNA